MPVPLGEAIYVNSRWPIAKTTRKTAVAKKQTDAPKAFAIEAARLAAETHCHDVVVLDVRNLSPVTDYFVIASGTSARQMRSVVDEINEIARPKGFKPMSRAGYDGETWILIDFVDVIVHIFGDEARRYFDLENLWGDARKVTWEK